MMSPSCSAVAFTMLEGKAIKQNQFVV